MNRKSPIIAELHTILNALCEETIAPDQEQRLDELVLAHPEAEAYYVQFMSMNAELIRSVAGLPPRAEQSVRERAGVSVTLSSPPYPDAATPTIATTSGGSRWRRLRGTMSLMALAAAVLFAIAFWPRGEREPHHTPDSVSEPTDDSVAVLIQSYRAEWEETGISTRPNSPLVPGRLVLKSGVARIEFYNGATVILEGPAEFRLVSRTEGYCERGKLRATVPPQAHGFRMGSPSVNVVDRGTEFGLDVGDKTEVHVFKGEVHLYGADATPETPPRELKSGDAVSLDAQGTMDQMLAQPNEFVTAEELAERAEKEIALRQQQWLKASLAWRADDSLIVYYTFGGEGVGSRTLRDMVGDRRLHDGAVVGCSWGTGRWRGRQGLEFKRMSDRVRLNVTEEFESLTLAAWVRPDALPNVNNSLLMADGWEEGECHWQIGSDGTLILGIKGPPDYRPEPNVRGPQYRAYGAITPDHYGRWVHIAVTYDHKRNAVAHYVDGQEVARSAILLPLTLRIGEAELGNWNPAGYRVKSPIRNFTGGFDEFMLFKRALDGNEVRELYTEGRSPL